MMMDDSATTHKRRELSKIYKNVLSRKQIMVAKVYWETYSKEYNKRWSSNDSHRHKISIPHINGKWWEEEEDCIELLCIIPVSRKLLPLSAGSENWNKMDRVISRVDSARSAGLNITADMYTYTAGATGLNAAPRVRVKTVFHTWAWPRSATG